MVPLVTFGVPVMTPAESPQDRRRPKMTDHILAILSARDGHGRWSGPDQDHARRSTCLPGHRTALAWPGDAVVAAVMAPVEGKNAKMTKSLSGSRAASGGIFGIVLHVSTISFRSWALWDHFVPPSVEDKNAKMTKSLSGSRTGPGAFSGLLCDKIRIFF